MAYLEILSASSNRVTRPIVDLHSRRLAISSNGQEKERDQLKAVFKYIIHWISPRVSTVSKFLKLHSCPLSVTDLCSAHVPFALVPAHHSMPVLA